VSSKLHALCDGKGRPLIMLLSQGQISDYKGAACMTGDLPKAKALLGDKGYDADWFRNALAARKITAASRRYLFTNHHGPVTAITDGSGNTIAINRYDEYGIPGAGNIGRFQYTGQARLEDLGMHHYKARIYSLTLGRFLQTDPIGYED